ncbi:MULTISPECIES: DUF732 domain-containing protein [Rhodococcus]|uniref:DUF732 domain-containing protein n=1 Tax=Rhodococcus TaxID=1827 RepID=UPI00042E3092|nr:MULTISPECIES: DUF732 domain-containing protein [Rhodococcus]KXF55267.1 hypothetical protein AXA44_38115 [Rhodococcus sp. SC4]RZK69877.1 MAG: DUF732 domain-containing protein [Rhodococcus sp. (in: high G+C Gram-positive bacteria)]AHK27702.1 hypothetical protein Pd630_LPD00458 [Rhodococcus opacus PD630]KXX57688.1 hypothetical protein AZG88_10630 [Rhodococcus sp. LB1]PBC55198.1 DUF732 domain-containing protein [Rhodococcus sp. ACPA1]
MPQHSRISTTFRRAIAVSALAVAASGLLVGCGSDDSTATSNPSTSATTTAAASSSAESSASAAPSASASAPASAPVTSPGEAATAPPEQPEEVPGDFPGPSEVPVSAEGQKFLDALKAKGIEPAADGTMAVSTADFICQAKAEGKSDAEAMVFVTAMVGTEASAAGQELTQEQATANAQTYMDVAHATYCK